MRAWGYRMANGQLATRSRLICNTVNTHNQQNACVLFSLPAVHLHHCSVVMLDHQLDSCIIEHHIIKTARSASPHLELQTKSSGFLFPKKLPRLQTKPAATPLLLLDTLSLSYSTLTNHHDRHRESTTHAARRTTREAQNAQTIPPQHHTPRRQTATQEAAADTRTPPRAPAAAKALHLPHLRAPPRAAEAAEAHSNAEAQTARPTKVAEAIRRRRRCRRRRTSRRAERCA